MDEHMSILAKKKIINTYYTVKKNPVLGMKVKRDRSLFGLPLKIKL